MENTTQHISQQFEHELQDIRSMVFAMGGLVEQQVAEALTALLENNTELARQVIAEDERVNNMEITIDEECTQILARRQPTASDLRLVTGIIKTVTDLERIGDEADRIAKMTLSMTQKHRPKKNYAELTTMGKQVQSMLHGALDAFARMDVTSALEVAQQDKLIDVEYEAILRQLITYMMEDPRTISNAIDLVWSVRSLERIGDHARNICEHVIYLVEGKDVRHLSLEKMVEAVNADR